MNKCLFCISVAVFFLFSFCLGSSAVGSCTSSILKPYISIHLIDDPDESFESFTVQYSLNNSAWVNLDTFSTSDLDSSGNFLYRVDDSIINLVNNGAYVRFRASASTPLSTVYSSPVTYLSDLPDDLYLTDLRLDGDTIFWDSNIYVFEISGNAWGVSVTHNNSTTVYTTTDRFFDISQFYNDLGVPDGDYEFTIHAFVRGQMYYSNTLSISGIPEVSLSVDTNVYYVPVDSDVPPAVDLLFSGVKNTAIMKYFMSGILIAIPFAAAVFLINKVH